MGKGDTYRPRSVSREEEALRWQYANGKFSGTLEQFNERIAEIRKRTGLPITKIGKY